MRRRAFLQSTIGGAALAALPLVALLTLGFGAPSLHSQAPRAVEFLRGDANVDGQVDVSDAVRTLIYLFVEPLALPCHDAADTDDNGKLELTAQQRVGRFGWKAGQATLKQQIAAALNTDMGVMTSIFPSPDCGSSQANCGDAGNELSDEHLQHLATYVSLLGIRARRDLNDPVTNRGEARFRESGCAGCHTPTLQTSEFHPHAELRDQTIHPYSDLLLHDMGFGLADHLQEENASGAEWRTAPLWGIGLTAGVSGGEAYLHDGRARSLREAILWHGGEAEGAKQTFAQMPPDDQEAVIAFLKSL